MSRTSNAPVNTAVKAATRAKDGKYTLPQEHPPGDLISSEERGSLRSDNWPGVKRKKKPDKSWDRER